MIEPDQSMPILIVEDEMFLAMDIERILEDAGYAVAAIAADQAEAMAAAASARVAFVDVNLRDGPTGPKIAQDLAENHGITVVYVTANPAQIVPLAKGALGIVAKPFRDTTILEAAALAIGVLQGQTTVSAQDLTLFDRVN